VILVDTSVWIDHLHATEPRLVTLLERDDVGCHPLVIEELALGSLARRETVLTLLESLRRFPALSHDEVMTLVNAHRLWGRGISVVDAHLLGSTALVGGARLWTRDKRLMAACGHAAVPVLVES
jgi:predicted nucleic acid-binding protein